MCARTTLSNASRITCFCFLLPVPEEQVVSRQKRKRENVLLIVVLLTVAVRHPGVSLALGLAGVENARLFPLARDVALPEPHGVVFDFSGRNKGRNDMLFFYPSTFYARDRRSLSVLCRGRVDYQRRLTLDRGVLSTIWELWAGVKQRVLFWRNGDIRWLGATEEGAQAFNGESGTQRPPALRAEPRTITSATPPRPPIHERRWG